jgi:hypothetical protein
LTEGRHLGAGDDAGERLIAEWDAVSDAGEQIVPEYGFTQAEREVESAQAQRSESILPEPRSTTTTYGGV